MKLCVIEDEPDLQDAIIKYLSGEGYICDKASTFSKARSLIDLYRYDCFLIDINLPDGSGIDLIGNIQEYQPDAGMVVVSARNSTNDKIRSLDLGADDYITKPFDLQELNARIRSVIRRRSRGGNKHIVFNEITIVPEEYVVKINDIQQDLTKREFDLLSFMITNKYRVISKEAILEHLWDNYSNAMDGPDIVYAHIKNLRKKLSDAGSSDYIRTVYGIGYKFTDRE